MFLFRFTQHIYLFLCLPFLPADLPPFGLIISLHKAVFHFRNFIQFSIGLLDLFVSISISYSLLTKCLFLHYTKHGYFMFCAWSSSQICSFSLMVLYFPAGSGRRLSMPVCGFMWAYVLWGFICRNSLRPGLRLHSLENISFAPPSWLYKHSGSTLIKILFWFFRYRWYNFIQKATWGSGCTYKFSSEISYHSLPA